MIKAIIFDMDGVLIDAREWHYVALNKALSLFGYSISYDQHILTFDGLPTRTKLEILSERELLPVGLHDFIAELKQEFTVNLAHQNCFPVFGKELALKSLKKRGYKLAVASNSIRETVELFLKKSSLIDHFEFYLGNQDVEHPKPSPEIYELAMRKLEVTPEQTLILEDNDHGYQAAIDSGAHVLRVSDPEDVVIQNIDAELDKLRLLQP